MQLKRAAQAAHDRGMATRYVTCPESAHLERIAFDMHPSYGLLVYACTRFDPPCSVDGARECARRLDQRRARDSERLLAVGDDTVVIALPPTKQSVG